MARSYDVPTTLPIGATYSGAGGGANSKLSVEANGQTLSRTTYPELSNYYADQTSYPFSGASMNGSSVQMLPFQSYNNNYITYAQTSSFVVYAQYITHTNYIGSAFWSTANGDDWKLMDLVVDGARPQKVKAIGSSIYICTTLGLYRTTDGLTVTKLFNGAVVDIASDGTNFLILNGTFSGSPILLRTTDFSTYTTLSLPSTTHRAIEYMGTTFYLFQHSSTSLWSSTNAGTTWTLSGQALNGTMYNNGTIVLNNTLIYFRNSNSGAAFVYNVTPLSAAWTASTTTWNSTNYGWVQGMVYDSSTGTYIVTTGRSANTGYFGWIFTSLSASGTILLSDVSYIAGNHDCIAYTSGANKYYGLCGAYQIKRTTWSETNMEIYQTDAYQHPMFFISGYCAGSTLPNGNRVVVKQPGNGSTPYYAIQLLLEDAGYFKPFIYNSTTRGFFYSSNPPIAHVFVQTNDGYIFSYYMSSYWYWVTADNSRTFVKDGGAGTPSPASTIMLVGVPNDGVYAWETAAVTNRTLYYANPLSVTNTTSTWRLSPSTTLGTYNVCVTTSEAIVTELYSAGPTSNPRWFTLKNGAAFFGAEFSLRGNTGGSVSVNTDAKIFKLNNIYYCYNSSTMYVSYDGSIFFYLTPSNSISSNLTSYTQISNDYLLGNMPVSFKFGVPYVDIIDNTGNNIRVNPQVFKPNNTISYYGLNFSQSQLYSAVANLAFNSSTQFKVPAIVSTTGQTSYIVAR